MYWVWLVKKSENSTMLLHFIREKISGCGAVGSAQRSGR